MPNERKSFERDISTSFTHSNDAAGNVCRFPRHGKDHESSCSSLTEDAKFSRSDRSCHSRASDRPE
jgi:hypothetical protein